MTNDELREMEGTVTRARNIKMTMDRLTSIKKRLSTRQGPLQLTVCGLDVLVPIKFAPELQEALDAMHAHLRIDLIAEEIAKYIIVERVNGKDQNQGMASAKRYRRTNFFSHR